MSDDPYIQRQNVRDAEYRRAYEEWVRSRSPQELAELKANGLDTPLTGTSASGFQEADFAESPLASEEPDIAGKVDEMMACEAAGKPVEGHEQTQEGNDDPALPDANPEIVWEVVRRLIGELLVQKNAKLALDCLALVSGVAFLGDSMTEIARRHAMTRAAVSKRCVELSEKLNLPPARAMRSLTARKAYARARNQHLSSNG
jgi:hypothetical protein